MEAEKALGKINTNFRLVILGWGQEGEPGKEPTADIELDYFINIYNYSL